MLCVYLYLKIMDYIGNKCYPLGGHGRETEEAIFRKQTFTI